MSEPAPAVAAAVTSEVEAGARHFDSEDPAWADHISGLLKAVVVPRPIAWVSTQGLDGILNVAPHSYFTVLAERPPILGFVSSGRKDTLRNVEARGEYVINIAGEEQIGALNITAADFPETESEFAWAGLTPSPSRVVDPPGVAEAPVAMEMRLIEVRPYGEQPSFLIAGEVVHIRVAERVLRGHKVAPELLRAVGRLAGSTYTRTGELFDLARPTYRGLIEGGFRRPDDQI
ncbi:MAG TPA: flavin reductase family protein [Thermomicrobiales bacterium]|nr:flavin reductase family protein [Thermomicrobiales bacterium]